MKILVSSRFFSVFLCVWVLGMLLIPSIHISSRPWYYGCITKYYGQGEGQGAEHGNDLSCFGYSTPVTALLSGVVSYADFTPFGYFAVTWKIDHPSLARGSPYMYMEDMAWIVVHTGQHINQGQVIGYSLSWVEFGLTPDYAYGISNWRWGINSYFLIVEARNGTLPLDIYYTARKQIRKVQSSVHCTITQLLQVGTTYDGSSCIRHNREVAREQVQMHLKAGIH